MPRKTNEAGFTLYAGKTLMEWEAADREERPASVQALLDKKAENKRLWRENERRKHIVENHDVKQALTMGAMKAAGDRFFAECGAIDVDGQYHFNDQVLSGLFRKAIVVVNYHLEQGSMEAAKLVIDKVVPEAPKQLAEMDTSELAVERQKILDGMSPQARAELLIQLAKRKRQLVEAT